MPQNIISSSTSQIIAKKIVLLQLLVIDSVCFIHLGLHPLLLFITHVTPPIQIKLNPSIFTQLVENNIVADLNKVYPKVVPPYF
jgi:hypothetical protein